MKSARQIVEQAESEVHRGRAWRAKEILRGAIASGRVEAEVLESYGRLLDSLGDRVEAGRYLFASGVRTAEYRDAIDLFIARHGKRRGRDLLAQLPTRLRKAPLASLPQSLRDDLSALGVPQSPARRLGASSVRVASGTGCAVAALVFVAIFVIGLVATVNWILSR